MHEKSQGADIKLTTDILQKDIKDAINILKAPCTSEAKFVFFKNSENLIDELNNIIIAVNQISKEYIYDSYIKVSATQIYNRLRKVIVNMVLNKYDLDDQEKKDVPYILHGLVGNIDFEKELQEIAVSNSANNFVYLVNMILLAEGIYVQDNTTNPERILSLLLLPDFERYINNCIYVFKLSSTQNDFKKMINSTADGILNYLGPYDKKWTKEQTSKFLIDIYLSMHNITNIIESWGGLNKNTSELAGLGLSIEGIINSLLMQCKPIASIVIVADVQNYKEAIYDIARQINKLCRPDNITSQNDVNKRLFFLLKKILIHSNAGGLVDYDMAIIQEATMKRLESSKYTNSPTKILYLINLLQTETVLSLISRNEPCESYKFGIINLLLNPPANLDNLTPSGITDYLMSKQNNLLIYKSQINDFLTNIQNELNEQHTKVKLLSSGRESSPDYTKWNRIDYLPLRFGSEYISLAVHGYKFLDFITSKELQDISIAIADKTGVKMKEDAEKPLDRLQNQVNRLSYDQKNAANLIEKSHKRKIDDLRDRGGKRQRGVVDVFA